MTTLPSLRTQRTVVERIKRFCGMNRLIVTGLVQHASNLSVGHSSCSVIGDPPESCRQVRLHQLAAPWPKAVRPLGCEVVESSIPPIAVEFLNTRPLAATG